MVIYALLSWEFRRRTSRLASNSQLLFDSFRFVTLHDVTGQSILRDYSNLDHVVQVVAEYFVVHVSHSTLQHHTNLHRHLTCLTCSTV